MKDEFNERFYNEENEFNGGYMKKAIDMGVSGDVHQLRVNCLYKFLYLMSHYTVHIVYTCFISVV